MSKTGKKGKNSFRVPKSISAALNGFTTEFEHLISRFVRNSQNVPTTLYELSKEYYALHGLSTCEELWKSSLGSLRIVRLVYRNGLEAYIKMSLNRDNERLNYPMWVILSIPKSPGSDDRSTFVCGMNNSRGIGQIHSEEFLVRCLLIAPHIFCSESDLKDCVLRHEDKHRQKALLSEFLERSGFRDLDTYISRHPERGSNLHEIFMWHCNSENNGADPWVPQMLNMPSGLLTIRKTVFQNGTDEFGNTWYGKIKVNPDGTLSCVQTVVIGRSNRAYYTR